MAIPTSTPGTISSGTINQLPDWYTNYAKTVTNLGQSLAESLPSYEGYVDASGNPVPRVAGLSGTQQKGIQTLNGNVGSYAPGMNAASGTVNSGVSATNGALSTVQGAGGNFGLAGGAANDAMSSIHNGIGQVGAATGAIQNMGGALGQAQSFLNPAAGYNARATDGSEYSDANMARYMNPYTQGVTSEIARLGNRNLMENVLPNINSTFVGAGQFGSTRNGDFVNRAIRDSGESILGAQSKVLADAQAQALQHAQAAAGRDLTAGAQTGALGSVATGIAQGFGNQAGTQINQGGATINGGQSQLQAGGLYNHIGDSQVGQGQAMSGIGGNLGALGQLMAQQAQSAHQMGLQDSQAQLAAGQVEQNTNQNGLDAAHQDFLDRRDYPLQALGGLSQILGGVSSKVQPNTQTVQVNATQRPDPIQSISDIINGMAAGSL